MLILFAVNFEATIDYKNYYFPIHWQHTAEVKDRILNSTVIAGMKTNEVNCRDVCHRDR